MDITAGYGPASGSSILSGPASISFRGIGANWEHMCFASMSKQFESAILHHSIAGLAHLVEQLPCKEKVVGSSPATGTKFIAGE